MSEHRSTAREALIRASWAVLDGTWWVLAVVLAVWLRYQYDVELSLTADTAFVAAGSALVLRYFNNKMRREAAVPIDADLEEQIRAQQQRSPRGGPSNTRTCSPSSRATPEGNVR